MFEQLGINYQQLTIIKDDVDCYFKQHLLFCIQSPAFQDFSILTPNNNDFMLP